MARGIPVTVDFYKKADAYAIEISDTEGAFYA
jgi:hypothetical protein